MSRVLFIGKVLGNPIVRPSQVPTIQRGQITIVVSQEQPQTMKELAFADKKKKKKWPFGRLPWQTGFP